MKKSGVAKALFIIAVCFYIVSAVMLYKGYDKMTNYRNSESLYVENINAYVGGDAYNYIINGNYATGFFVLSVGFLLTGTICVGTGLIIKCIPDNISSSTIKEANIESKDDELPEL